MFLCIQRLILPRPSSRRKRPFHAQKTLSSRTSYKNNYLITEMGISNEAKNVIPLKISPKIKKKKSSCELNPETYGIFR
jgi:hypothetical protein